MRISRLNEDITLKKYFPMMTALGEMWFIPSWLVKYASLRFNNVTKPPFTGQALWVFSCMEKGYTKPFVQLLSWKVMFIYFSLQEEYIELYYMLAVLSGRQWWMKIVLDILMGKVNK
jgi:hypothetical protein